MSLLDVHRSLVADHAGQEAFRRAIEAVVSPGDVVLDLGTGSGLHAGFACRAGARRVYAIDREPIVELARQIWRASGCADRIVGIQALIDDVELPEPVDVVVANLGVDDLFALVPRAARRFLKAWGRVVPSAVTFFAAPVECGDLRARCLDVWRPCYGLDLTPGRTVAANTVHDWRLEPEHLLAPGTCLGEFATTDPAVRLASRHRVAVTRSGRVDGIATWMIERLAGDIVVSTEPPTDLPLELWPNAFYPVEPPLSVEGGDTIEMAIDTGGGQWGNVWRWEVVHRRAGEDLARAAHSTFVAELMSREALRRQAPDHAPRLTPRGRARLSVLELADGGRTVDAIEREAHRRHADLFASAEDAAVFVAEVLARYSD